MHGSKRKKLRANEHVLMFLYKKALVFLHLVPPMNKGNVYQEILCRKACVIFFVHHHNIIAILEIMIINEGMIMNISSLLLTFDLNTLSIDIHKRSEHSCQHY